MQLKNPKVGNRYKTSDGKSFLYLGGSKNDQGKSIAKVKIDDGEMETMSMMDFKRMISKPDIEISIDPNVQPARPGRKKKNEEIQTPPVQAPTPPVNPDPVPPVEPTPTPTPTPQAPERTPSKQPPPAPPAPKPKRDGFFKELGDGLLWWLGVLPKKE